MQTLPEWLIWIVFNGGAGIVAFKAIDWLELWPAFKRGWDKLPAEIRRYISFALAGALGLLAFWGQVRLGYVASPSELRGWLEAAFPIVVAQIVHARLKLARG